MSKKKVVSVATAGMIGLGSLIAWNACTVKIPTGHVGLIYKLSGGIDANQTPLSQGLNFKSPFDKVSKYPVSLTTILLTNEGRQEDAFVAIGKDNNQMTVSMEMSYSFEQESLPSTFIRFKGQSGEQIEDTFIRSKVKSWSAEALSSFDTFDVYGGSRAEANKAILEHLKAKFSEYGINVEAASIVDIKLDEKTTQTINNKIQRQQEVETAKLEAEKAEVENAKKIAEAKADAEQKKVKAEAEAEAILIKAEAEAQANEMLKQSISQELIEQQRIEKWNGEYPQVVSDASTILDLK